MVNLKKTEMYGLPHGVQCKACGRFITMSEGEYRRKIQNPPECILGTINCICGAKSIVATKDLTGTKLYEDEW